MRIIEEQYARIREVLPVQRGNVRLGNLELLNALLYALEHGCKWRGVPKQFGHWHTIYTRMNRWSNNGVLDRVCEICSWSRGRAVNKMISPVQLRTSVEWTIYLAFMRHDSGARTGSNPCFNAVLTPA